MTLNLQDLVVTSFTTSDDVAGRSVTEPITDPNDPTPDTGCYDCPRATQVDCA